MSILTSFNRHARTDLFTAACYTLPLLINLKVAQYKRFVMKITILSVHHFGPLTPARRNFI